MKLLLIIAAALHLGLAFTRAGKVVPSFSSQDLARPPGAPEC